MTIELEQKDQQALNEIMELLGERRFWQTEYSIPSQYKETNRLTIRVDENGRVVISSESVFSAYNHPAEMILGRPDEHMSRKILWFEKNDDQWVFIRGRKSMTSKYEANTDDEINLILGVYGYISGHLFALRKEKKSQ